jgi:sec-independent protein translocase protein TatA
MPFNLGAPEMIVLLLVLVLLFGAKKLPDLGTSVGKSIKNFKKGIAEAKDEVTEPEPTRSAPGEKQ